MLKIIRIYNQNRRKVWLGLIIVVFIMVIISLIEQVYQKQAIINNQKILQEQAKNKEKKNPSDTVDYNKASTSLTSGEGVNNSVRDEIQGLLEQFTKSVTNNQIHEAYALLSKECKQIQYPSVEIFANSYCKEIINKTYNFQLWSYTNGIYVYQVEYIENLLSTGINTTKNSIQDYITVKKQDGEYKLSINKLIQKRDLNTTAESKNIQIKLNNVETYLDYEYYEIEIKNNSDKEIILDTKEKDDTTYVKNNDGIKIRALLYENDEQDLKIESKETKTIKIKFNNTYNAKKAIQCIGFENIIIDQEKYKKDAEDKNAKMKLEVYLR